MKLYTQVFIAQSFYCCRPLLSFLPRLFTMDGCLEGSQCGCDLKGLVSNNIVRAADRMRKAVCLFVILLSFKKKKKQRVGDKVGGEICLTCSALFLSLCILSQNQSGSP